MIGYGKCKVLLFFIFVGLVSLKVWAGPSPNELLMLPKYCQARLGDDDLLKEQWEKQLGKETWLHLHHYCFGINFMNRANLEFSNNRIKKRYYQSAIGNFNYVLMRWKPSSNLYKSAELYKQRATSSMTMLNVMQ